MLKRVISLIMGTVLWWDLPLFPFASMKMKNKRWKIPKWQAGQPIMEMRRNNARDCLHLYLWDWSIGKVNSTGDNASRKLVMISKQMWNLFIILHSVNKSLNRIMKSKKKSMGINSNISTKNSQIGIGIGKIPIILITQPEQEFNLDMWGHTVWMHLRWHFTQSGTESHFSKLHWKMQILEVTVIQLEQLRVK